MKLEDASVVTAQMLIRRPVAEVFELLQALIDKAHRERAETMYRLIVQPIRSFSRAKHSSPDHAGRKCSRRRGLALGELNFPSSA